MTVTLSIFFTVTLVLCFYQMRKIRKLSFRIEQLESSILGSRTGRKIPYESLNLLNSLRRKAKQWTQPAENPALLTIQPVFIELLDDYISKLLESIPELNSDDEVSPLIEPRPQYSSVYPINSVMIFLESDISDKRPISFYCASNVQAKSIANLLALKGIDARADQNVSIKPE